MDQGLFFIFQFNN